MDHPSPPVRLVFDGPGAEEAAREVALLLGEGWGLPTRPEPPEPPAVRTRLDADPVAVAALVLSLPSAALATWDLASRLRVKDRVSELLDWLQEVAGSTVLVSIPGIGVRPVSAVGAGDLLAAAPPEVPALPEVSWDVYLACDSRAAPLAEAVYQALRDSLRVYFAPLGSASPAEEQAAGPEAPDEALAAMDAARLVALLVPATAEAARRFLERREVARAVHLARSHPHRWRLVPIWEGRPPSEPGEVPYGLGYLPGIPGRDGPREVTSGIRSALSELSV